MVMVCMWRHFIRQTSGEYQRKREVEQTCNSQAGLEHVGGVAVNE